MKLSGKPVVLRARDDHRSPVQDGNAGVAADTRLCRMHAVREIPAGQLMPLLAALDRMPAVIALGSGDSELALRFMIVVLVRVSVPAW